MRHTRALSLGLIVPDRAGCRRLLARSVVPEGWPPAAGEQPTAGPVAR